MIAKAWNNMIDCLARERKSKLLDVILKPSPSRGPVADLIWICALLIFPAPIGYALSGWIGVGVGLLMTISGCRTVSEEHKEAYITLKEYVAAQRAASDAALYILGWKLVDNGPTFYRDEMPWLYPASGVGPD